MSILIKGIDLPKDAQAVQVSYWTKDGHYIAESYPPSRIVEIPTPHGRLKDETELADILDKKLDSIAMERESISKSARLSLIRDLALKFHNAPTILAEE